MRNYIIYIGIFLYLFLNHATLGQQNKKCVNAWKDSINAGIIPNYLLKKSLFESELLKQMAFQKNVRIKAEIIRIPVVIHVVHNQSNNQIQGNNISDEQIYSQIKVLNEDYRKKIGTLGHNQSPLGSDTEIEFFLATIDSEGKPSTGITRTYSNKSSFNITNELERSRLSDLAYWDANKYLNIWVTNLSSGYIGYGEFPFAESVEGLDIDVDEKLDGVYIDSSVFGRKIGTNVSGIYSFGRTLTHEVGHWLGLYHTWGDQYCGTDYVSDTPPTANPNNSIFCVDIFSECDGSKTRNMIENYMDYSPDSCMNIFTYGQKDRMRAALEMSKRRKRLIAYAKYQLPTAEKLTVNLENPLPSESMKIQVLLPDFQDILVQIRDIFGRLVFENTYKDLPSTILSLDTKMIPGTYLLNVRSNGQQVSKRILVY